MSSFDAKPQLQSLSGTEMESSASGTLLDELALLPEQALVDEAKLAQLLQVSTRTVRRRVACFELPPPFKLGSKSMWMVGRVREFFSKKAKQAEKVAAKEASRLNVDVGFD